MFPFSVRPNLAVAAVSTARIKKAKMAKIEWDAEPSWKLPDDLEEFRGDPEDRKGRRAFEQRRKEALASLEKEKAAWRKEQRSKKKMRLQEVLQGFSTGVDAEKPPFITIRDSNNAGVTAQTCASPLKGLASEMDPNAADEEPGDNAPAAGACWGREHVGTAEDLLWELEERTLPNVTTNGSHLFGRDWRQHFRMETRYRGHKSKVPAPGPTGVNREDLPDGGVVKMCQGVMMSKSGQLCVLPETGAAWKVAEEERQEERDRWDTLRLAFAPLEKKRAQEQTAQGGKAGSARGDLKATTALEDEYAWGFDGRPPPDSKTRKALRTRDPHKIASAFMQKLNQAGHLNARLLPAAPHALCWANGLQDACTARAPGGIWSRRQSG